MVQLESVETYRGVVYPAQCDAMGHMNVQYYVAAFDQSMWRLVDNLGYRKSKELGKEFGWADVRHVIDYKSELPVGSLYRVTSEVRRVGRSSLVTFHRMTNTTSGTLSAECEMTSVYFDLTKRISSAIPEPLLGAAKSRLRSDTNYG